MKLIVFLLLLPLAALSQSDSLQKNSEGIYELTGVIHVDSVSAANLFSRAQKFVAVNSNSLEPITQLNDDNDKLTVGKGTMTAFMYNSFGNLNSITNVDYTITVQCKDNRYKYTISNFLVYVPDSIRIALEDESYWNKRRWAKRMWSDTKQEIYSKMKTVIGLLKNSMASDSTKDW